MFINYLTREINCKVIYAGPALAGAADNLRFIYDHGESQERGKLTKLNTGIEPTLFFDYLPAEFPPLRGFALRLHLYTVPDQQSHDASRLLILKGVDGIVFVADSQPWRMPANKEALDSLEQEVSSLGYDLTEMPYVLQLNNRAGPKSAPVAEMKANLLLGDEPVVEAVTETGIGVFETVNALSQLIRQDLAEETPPAAEVAATPRTTTVPGPPHRTRRDSPPVTRLRHLRWMTRGFLRRWRRTG